MWKLPFYGNDDNKYIKIKTKTFKNSIIASFHNKKAPEEKNTISMFIDNSVSKTEIYITIIIVIIKAFYTFITAS